MKTFIITTPNTNEVSSMQFMHKGTKQQALDHALWAYNSARAHDGLEPLAKLPRGTVCKGEKKLYIVMSGREVVSTLSSFDHPSLSAMWKAAREEVIEYDMAHRTGHTIHTNKRGFN